MKLLVIILVCSQLHLNGAHSEMLPTFCDDGLVEAAVDEAIKTYNKELVSGNQFARYQITEAKKSENGSETTYKVNFHVRESDCPVGGDKIWLECDYLPEGKAKMRPCTTEVKHSGETNKVVSVTCHALDEERIVAERAPCLGCPREIPTNNTELMKALQHALKKFNNESNSPKLFVISVIKKATIQVVAGWKYNAYFEIQQSNCSKAEFEEITPECQPENSVVGNCNASIYVVPWKQEVHPVVNCETEEIPTVLLRMPPGMSPFRAIALNVRGKKSSEESKEHVTQSPDSVPTDCKHASGEESQEQTAGSGPIGPVPGPVVINPEMTGEPVRLLELLGGPGPVDLHHLFHCPSKPWKSVDSHVVTHAPQPESVTDGPPTVVTEDKSKQSGTFSDADLLAGL
ncbi:kininogen-like [Acipenser ruthenus]|uniref:kininogen-like n=1 Tax=Acipenser ruthenus TaxID=7906 RepID=UPI002740B506|nr:kininogen-like [Acipenser ruthenus]